VRVQLPAQYSQTFPSMSYRPQALGLLLRHGMSLVLGAAVPPRTLVDVAQPGSFDPARHAYSHSASVGSRYAFPGSRRGAGPGEGTRPPRAPYPAGPVSDPTGPAHGYYKVSRGGSRFDVPAAANPSFRSSLAPDDRTHSQGLRLARSTVEK